MTGTQFSEITSKQDQLKSLYYSIYRQDSSDSFERLLKVMATATQARPAALQMVDQGDPHWYMSNKLVGMMLYTDLFAGNLEQVAAKIPYFKELGITYIHFMPLLKAREGENDGGYAVADYRQIDPRFGSMEQFRLLVDQLRAEGIYVCLDYVVNHTAKDHEWAKRALAGEKDFQNLYLMYDTDETPRHFEATVPEVFPKVAPGNFTYYKQIKKWVFTSFYEFQWDLNYHNPAVFEYMTDVLLYLANTGVQVIRLDAIPFMWKELGTSCRNLPQVHVLLKMFHLIIEMVCPSVVLLGEAIVEPHQIVKYFGNDDEQECQILYNAAHMVNIWNSLATRDARLMAKSVKYGFHIPKSGCWITYARCHDDIGWGLNENIIKALGFDPSAHKQFLISFFKGDHPFSFSRGELYEFNPETLDARNSGSMASLAGLEAAIATKDMYQRELAIKRILLINALLLAEAGLPLIYSGDEIATLNDYTYKDDPKKAHDSRWLHRPFFDWARAENRHILGTAEGQVFSAMQQLIKIRGEHDIFRSDIPSKVIECYEPAVYCFAKYLADESLIILCNFSDDRQLIDTHALHSVGIFGSKTDLITGKTVDFTNDRILLGPYEYVWLEGRS
ncbi:MAG: alpha-amylase family protein [Eubacteriales bacterium]|nr:alpha-amylase family protein [Eubacteriales bacterium]